MTISTIPIPNTNNIAIDWQWFNSTSQVGIVLCEDNVTHKTKAYIGAITLKGNDEPDDVIHIAQWGAKIPKAIAEACFGPLPDYAW